MLLLQVVVGGLLLGAIYALFSSGLTLIWGMMNVINFAHGEFVMLGMYVALLVVVWTGGGPEAFGFAAAFALFALGVCVYLSLIRHVMRGPDARADSLHLRIGAAAALHRFLDLLGELRFAAANFVFRHAQPGRNSAARPATRGGRGRGRLDHRTPPPAYAHDPRQPAACRRRGPQRRHAHGHSPRSHAGDRLGTGGSQRRDCGRADGDVLPLVALGGETFGLTAFVVVTLGGFGSVPGAMYAGLIIGLVQALSAYWLGPIYKDIIVYALFAALLWLRPQGLMGKA